MKKIGRAFQNCVTVDVEIEKGARVMNKKTVMTFYQAYGYEPNKETEQVIKDVLAVWAKTDKHVAKSPALLKKGVVFGMGLAKLLNETESKGL